MSLNKLNQLYRLVILDHATNSHHHYEISHPTNKKLLHNTSCGDTVKISFNVDSEGIITDIGFVGQGCTISQASASILTDTMQGKQKDEALELVKIFSDIAKGSERSPEDVAKLGDAQVLTNIMEFPARIKCATLAWWAFQEAFLPEENEVE
ncbi:Fe-S cluster assembly sulfur transfer protein SufU [Lactobacillaceae bacterium 24-114]